ncbi:MAG: DEAD/DEAH box helicase family protein [Bdellovibrionales bacterium]|nr:DEAD/DEAH box helicase family protein [Bdellovibrionales bacterium]
MTQEEQEAKSFNRLSPLQIFYYTHLLTLKKPKWNRETIDQAVIEAKVDLNPHQIEAATFAFRNPFSGGVILADEVGLGKTIEAGLILSQLWAEGKRSFLIVAPKSLRHQWQDELRNLFYIDSQIIDTSAMRALEKSGSGSPLKQREKVIITNEHFFNRYSDAIQNTKWDLIVIDEAHKLRNVWKPAKKQAQRAKLIRETIKPFKKLLLTATPMQNNLMELYGLTSFIDETVLGTQESFQQTFYRIPEEHREERLSELKYRMKRFFHRELRRNVSDFIRYTNRNAVTFEFDPEDEEEQLRKEFEAYLKRENTYGIPPMASHLLRLIYCKLLASSSFALKNSLLGIYKRLVITAVQADNQPLFGSLMSRISKKFTLENGKRSQELEDFERLLFKKIRSKSYAGLREAVFDSELVDLADKEGELLENYDEDDFEKEDAPDSVEVGDRIVSEADEILNFISLTRKIRENTKGHALKAAIEQQFEKAKTEGWPQKAVIFTEFKTTQQYVINVLEQMGMTLDSDIVVFNGSVGDAESRRRLVNEFRDSKKIFLTTEAGAEGLNLQFCNLIVNYDLPWNPQRIEQRIGRCHRYGQELDVVVVNFINKKNHADRRVLELLGEKFKLFEGAFGASDEVLGAIQSGNDIEKEILKIYLGCRTEEEINARFEEMFKTNWDQIDARLQGARDKLINEFDEDVRKKLKDLHDQAKSQITGKQAIVRDCVLSALDQSVFSYKDGVLDLRSRSLSLDSGIPYTFSKDRQSTAELVHSNHTSFRSLLPSGEFTGHVCFKLSGRHKISLIDGLKGRQGQFAIYKLALSGIDSFEAIVPIFQLSAGSFLSDEEAHKLLTVTSDSRPSLSLGNGKIEYADELESRISVFKRALVEHSEDLYHEEIEKIEGYFDDLEVQKRYEKEALQKQIEEIKQERRKLPLNAQRDLNQKISRLKDKQVQLDQEIAELSLAAQEKQKQLVEDLDSKINIQLETRLLASGTCEVL